MARQVAKLYLWPQTLEIDILDSSLYVLTFSQKLINVLLISIRLFEIFHSDSCIRKLPEGLQRSLLEYYMSRL